MDRGFPYNYRASLQRRGYKQVKPADIAVGDVLFYQGCLPQIASINREAVDRRTADYYSFGFYIPVFVQGGQVGVVGMSVPTDCKMWRKV